MIILRRKGGQKWLTGMVKGVSMLNFLDFGSRPVLLVIGPAWFLIRNSGERREANIQQASTDAASLFCCCLIARSMVNLPWFLLRCGTTLHFAPRSKLVGRPC